MVEHLPIMSIQKAQCSTPLPTKRNHMEDVFFDGMQTLWGSLCIWAHFPRHKEIAVGSTTILYIWSSNLLTPAHSHTWALCELRLTHAHSPTQTPWCPLTQVHTQSDIQNSTLTPHAHLRITAGSSSRLCKEPGMGFSIGRNQEPETARNRTTPKVAGGPDPELIDRSYREILHILHAVE